jgi:glucosamine--fructose-6-phosphate aminotransferase (isomerizing)
MSDGSPAGRLFFAEIGEQPAVLTRLAGCRERFGRVAAELQERRIRTIRLVAHGSSDNAASYGVYVFGLLAGLTAFRDSISLPVYYGVDIDVSDSCVLALSQSGKTPDVVRYLERAAGRGAFTIAVTNDPESPLGRTAHSVLPLMSGEERAIAATKTYLAELAVLVLLAAHLAGSGETYTDAVEATGALLEGWLPDAERMAGALAADLAGAGRVIVLGRGPGLATAREIALKLLETCHVGADAMTPTDFAHGPVAALDRDVPVWVIADADASLPAGLEAIARAREAGAPVIATGAAAGALEGGARRYPVPAAPLPLLSPLLSVVLGQLAAGLLARAKGLDPDRPAGLAKVTLAA